MPGARGRHAHGAEQNALHGATGPTMVAALTLAALGVVFGDIGTSPLYAFKECFTGGHALTVTPANVLGVLSLMVWSLVGVVAVKYLVFVLRADNHGEGGILALLALVPEHASKLPRGAAVATPVVLLGLFGAALLYGDGVITPAISVLSAVEGLNVATRAFEPVVVPATIVILVGLFVVQSRGTGGIGRVFGPIMLIWFSTIALLGAVEVAKHPGVLSALNPAHAVGFLAHGGWHSFFILGSVVLCVTGGEALYADMGHFGRGPIRLGWFALVMPALLANYFGQGAAVLGNPASAGAPFFALVPRWGLYPMVALATVATVIASQALISGAFSLTRQAVQLGYCPRVTIVHTSHTQAGQIYVPEVNWALAIGCVALVLEFKSSTALAAAYGVAVTGTMAITSVLYFVVVRRRWGWSLWTALPLMIVFLVFDGGFFAACSVKILQGGWVPLAIAAVAYTLMTTWKAGRARLLAQIASLGIPMEDFLAELVRTPVPRVAGTAVFLAANPRGTPPALRHHLKHAHSLHEQVVVLSIVSEGVPAVSPRERVRVTELGQGFTQVTARYGFMETPNVPALLEVCAIFGVAIDPETVTYYLGRETLLPTGKGGMMRWRKALFVFISKNARAATAYFGIPPDRVVELGVQLEL